MKEMFDLKVLGTINSGTLRTISINSSSYYETVEYQKVSIERMNQMVLKTLIEMTHTQDVNIVDMGIYYIYSYKNKNPIFLSKQNGLIYAQEDTYNHRREAIIFLQKLNKLGYVQRFKRHHSSKQKVIQGWIE